MKQKNKCAENKIAYPSSLFLIICTFLCLLGLAAGKDEPKTSLLDLSLEELMEIEIRPTATLTKTERKLTPAAMTIITKQDIENSGARSLDELLDMYVPNFQMALHVWETRHLGLRGTISDRDDKYLLLVNGRVMNDRVHYGAISERDLPMLGDINRVEVVRGPGSAMYGPGALFMVVNIITDTPKTYEGAEFRTRLGAIDEFYTWETKFAKKFADDSGILIYAGAAEQPGTDSRKASFAPGRPYTYQGQNYTGREEVGFGKLRGYNQSFRDQTKLKIYGQYMKDDFNFWARYTQGGNHYTMYSEDLDSATVLPPGEGYRQLTLWGGNRLEVTDTVNVDYSFSYDTLDFVRHIDARIENHRQDEYHTKVILNWQPHEDHSIAVGGEYSHERFGRRTRGYPDAPAGSTAWGWEADYMPKWSSDTMSVLGEYQWKISDYWTLFIGGRIDWHSYVKREMFSPRAAIVYTPNEKDTIKFIVQRSTRASMAESMKSHKEQTGRKSDYETMDYYELRWERQHNKNWWYAVSGFYSSHNIIGWEGGAFGVSPLGELQLYGIEAELAYKTEKAKIAISHGYTKLIDMKLKQEGAEQFFTAKPYGYGDDLANWHNHVTKITASYDVTEKLNLYGSLNTYWGIPGKKDYVDRMGIYNAGSTPYQPSFFLNLGMGYAVTENLKVRAHAHNVLGWLNQRFNKRNFGFGNQEAGYLLEAPSLSFSMLYCF